MVLCVAVIAVAVILDQLVKHLVVSGMALGQSIPVIEGVFHITRFHNTGAAFSSFEGQRALLIALPVVLIIVGAVFLWKYRHASLWFRIPVAMIIGGGIGNLIDRIFRGGRVVDYFDFQLCNFAVFNFADVCVTVGVALMIIGILFFEKELPEAKKLPQAKRIPYERTAAALPEAGELPAAGELPEAAAAPMRPEPDAEKSHADA